MPEYTSRGIYTLCCLLLRLRESIIHYMKKYPALTWAWFIWLRIPAWSGINISKVFFLFLCTQCFRVYRVVIFNCLHTYTYTYAHIYWYICFICIWLALFWFSVFIYTYFSRHFVSAFYSACLGLVSAYCSASDMRNE